MKSILFSTWQLVHALVTLPKWCFLVCQNIVIIIFSSDSVQEVMELAMNDDISIISNARKGVPSVFTSKVIILIWLGC